MTPTSTNGARSKRKAASPIPASKTKKPKPDFSDRTRYKESSVQIEHGIVVRPYYPAEMSNERARKYINGEIERPIETLQKASQETEGMRKGIKVGKSVVFWFKNDLRLSDNKGLHLASELAKKEKVPLVCVYLVSPQDWEAHLVAPVRVDFILRTLEVLRKDLGALDIPLLVESVKKRRMLPGRLMELCEKFGANHVFCNMEYEVDELRREAALTRQCVKKGISFDVLHDTCVVEPGKLTSGTGGQLSIYTPWWRKWVAYLNAHPKELHEFPRPGKNPSGSREKFKEVFETKIPEAPENKKLSDDEKKRFKTMWPPGEHEAMERLEKFVSQKIKQYHDMRNLPAGNGTAVLSVHFAAGTLATRTAIRMAQEAAPTKVMSDEKKLGHSMWISEVAWRDFYKHVLVNWPFTCMNKSFKPEYTDIEWEYNTEQFKAWCEGKTGYPIVDAAMRQLNHTGYMHNRCRMIAASFLAKDLMIDWRMGERYFMEHLTDGDFASNNGGWGFSASSGVDPQPYFRIFNPLLQSEKFDADGEYIRKWVKELAEVKDKKAIHDPYGRGAAAIAKKSGYPKVIVEHKGSRERALARYKAGLAKPGAA